MFVLEFKFSYTLIQRNGNINIDKWNVNRPLLQNVSHYLTFE